MKHETSRTAEEQLRPYVPEMLLRWPHGVTAQTIAGTLASADISGFTALSERLAARGREGAEELTYLINASFDGMIEDCNAEGGDILKFGGDAILVFFHGPAHVERACRAAYAMRRAIRTPQRTSDGKRVALAVSIGVHTGDHRFCVVSNGHTELIVTGEHATATVDAESEANAGEILLTPPTAAALTPAWLGGSKAGGTLLRRTFGAPLSDPSPPSYPRSASEFIPSEQQDQILADALNEHRQVSTAFVEFSGTDSIPTDVLAQRLQSLATTVWTACERHGAFWLSSDVYHDGGKFIVTAGAPLSRGGDEDRLLRTVREIVDNGPDLQLRVGVNRGYVFAGDLGSTRRRTYTVMGDATNLAARLMAKADAGEIVVSRPLIDWASSNVEYDPLEPFLVKGKSVPIMAGRLGRLLGRRTDLDRVDTDLCGRSEELSLLLERADAAISGTGSVTLLTGDPGIGKSRLALEVLRQRPDLTIAFARCQPYDRLAAYSVAQPLVRALLGIDADADRAAAGAQLVAWLEQRMPNVASLAPLVAAAIDAAVAETPQAAAIAPEFRRVRTLRLLVAIVQRAVVRPVALFVDDVNQADDASREFLAALGESLTQTPLFAVATSVPADDLVPGPIELGPLSERDIARLIDSLLGERVIGADVVRTVLTRSGGNPLFVGELVRSLVENPNAAMPESLDALVATRIDALDAADRRLLRQASVLGTEVDINILGMALGDRLIRRVDRWERLSRFLEWAAPGVVRFRYDTYWRVVYNGLSFSARRSAHRVVMGILERDPAPDARIVTLLAAHASGAGDRPRLWRYATQAASNAAEQSNFGEAARLYKMAIPHRDAAETGADGLVTVVETAADVFERSGEFVDALRSLATCARLTKDPVLRARLLRKRGEVAERQGDYATSRRLYNSAQRSWEALLWTENVAERAALSAARGGLAFRQGDYQRAWDLAASAFAQAKLIGDFRIAAKAALTLSNLAQRMSWTGTAVDPAELIDVFARSGDLVAEALYLNNRAVDLYFDGEWEEAARLYRDVAQRCERSGDVVYEATALNNIAEILSDQGRYGDAEELLRTAYRSWQAVGFATGIALAEANLGRLATRTGDFSRAAGLLSSATTRFERLGAQAFLDEVALRSLENRLLAGEPTTDADHARCREMTERADNDANLKAYAFRLIAMAYALDGNDDDALHAIERSIETARSAGIPFELAQSLMVRARWDSNTSDEVEAHEIYAQLGVAGAQVALDSGSMRLTARV